MTNAEPLSRSSVASSAPLCEWFDSRWLLAVRWSPAQPNAPSWPRARGRSDRPLPQVRRSAQPRHRPTAVPFPRQRRRYVARRGAVGEGSASIGCLVAWLLLQDTTRGLVPGRFLEASVGRGAYRFGGPPFIDTRRSRNRADLAGIVTNGVPSAGSRRDQEVRGAAGEQASLHAAEAGGLQAVDHDGWWREVGK
jgi:hypothetical protein